MTHLKDTFKSNKQSAAERMVFQSKYTARVKTWIQWGKEKNTETLFSKQQIVNS